MNNDLLVRDLMASEVVTLNRNDALTIADDVMKLGRIRHMPVLDDDEEEVVGIVSQRDLFRGALTRALGYGDHAEQKLLAQLFVKEIMTTAVVTISPDAPLDLAANLMLEHKIGCVVAIDAGQLAGILTESDFVRTFVKQS